MKKKKHIPHRGYRKTAGRGHLYDVQAINFGWFERKHGILLENLPPAKKKLLLDHAFMKFLSSDPQTFEIIFIIEDNWDWYKVSDKTYWNPYIDNFTTYKQLLLDSNLIDWQCAICKADIVCRTDSPKKPENFVCDTCEESHNSKNTTVDRRIIDSSRNLTKHVKTLLKKEQHEFISYVERSLDHKPSIQADPGKGDQLAG